MPQLYHLKNRQIWPLLVLETLSTLSLVLREDVCEATILGRRWIRHFIVNAKVTVVAETGVRCEARIKAICFITVQLNPQAIAPVTIVV